MPQLTSEMNKASLDENTQSHSYVLKMVKIKVLYVFIRLLLNDVFVRYISRNFFEFAFSFSIVVLRHSLKTALERVGGW